MADLARRVVGLLLFLIVVTPIVMAATRTIAQHLPRAPRLVRAVGGLGLTVAVLQLAMTFLGLLGLLKLVPILVLLLLVGLIWLWYSPDYQPPADRASVERSGGPWRAGALVGLAVVTVQWSWWTGLALREGVQRSDSLTYHLPTALSFAHSGSVRTPVPTTIGSPASYYTEGMEVLHAMGMVLTRSDVLTCVSGFLFATLALAACWSIGARYERGWLATLLGCVALASPAVVQTQAGSALVDIPAMALVLSAAAALVWADLRRAGFVVPLSFIAGAALASKLLVLPVVLAVLLIAVTRATKRHHAFLYAGLAFVECVPWLIRNWVKTGTPLPMVDLPGFPHLHFDQVTQLGRSAGHYFWDALRYPHVGAGLVDGMRSGLGITWPLLVLACIGALVFAIRNLHVAPFMLTITAAAMFQYLASPFGAGGPGDPPFLFAVNLRYAAIAIISAGVLLACSARRAGSVRWIGGLGLATLLVTAVPTSVLDTTLSTYTLQSWPEQGKWLGVIVAVVAAALAFNAARPQWRQQLSERMPSRGVAIGATACLVLVGIGVARSDVTNRFPGAGDLAAVYRYTNTLENERIGVMGLERTYPLAGRDLSNRVDALVSLDADGVPLLPATCAELQRLVTSSRSSYVVVRDNIAKSYDTHECLTEDEGLEPVARSGDISVWRSVSVGQRKVDQSSSEATTEDGSPQATEPASQSTDQGPSGPAGDATVPVDVSDTVDGVNVPDASVPQTASTSSPKSGEASDESEAPNVDAPPVPMPEVPASNGTNQGVPSLP